MKRIKDNPRKLNCQAPRLQLLFDLPSHTTLHYIIINYEVTEKKCFHPPPPLPVFKVAPRSLKSKQKRKASRRGERKKERTRETLETKSLRRRKKSLNRSEIEQEVMSHYHVLPSLNKVALLFMSDLKLHTSKLQNNALSSGRT